MAVKGNMIIGQSGGPTVVINQTLIGAIEEALKHEEIENIYGMRHGIQGLLDEQIVDLKKESKETLEKVANTPGAALGSCRYKPTKEDCEKVFEICKKYNIRYFFYIGGNDTAESSEILNSIAQQEGYDLHVFHLPKTIDNDLRETDHCPGYGSAAKYVAMLFMGDNMDNLSLKGIKINIVMGRNAGWLTAASALARQKEGDGPHLIYVPERPVSLEKIVEDIDKVYSKYGRAVVAVSEGLRNINGELMLKSGIKEVDAYGNIQLSGTGALGDFLASYVREKLSEKYNKKIRVRADTLGYAQRSFPGVSSMVDKKEAREVGQAGVKFAIQGHLSGSVIIKRTGTGSDYNVEYDIVDLKKVARVTKPLLDEYIASDGNDVTDEFIKYAKPLVGELPEMARLNFYPVK